MAAFNQQHPWAAEVRLAINFEGAGGDGPALLYATSEENNWLVDQYLKAAPNPYGSSLLPAIVNLYTAGRLDCDLGEYTANGSAGLGFVVLGDTPVYHTIRDNPDEIDSGSIQQEGDNTLAAVRHFGNLDLSGMPRSGDRASSRSGRASSSTTPTVGDCAGGRYHRADRRSDSCWSAAWAAHATWPGGRYAGVLLGALAALVVAVALWFAIHELNSDYQVMLVGNYQSGRYVVALSFATLAVVALIYTLLDGTVRRSNLVAGALIGGLIPLWVASLLVPGMSYLVAWPLLFAALPLTWTLFGGRRATARWWRMAILAVAAIPAIVILPGTLQAMLGLVNRLEGLSGIGLLGALMLFVAPLAGLFVPHLHFLTGDLDPSRRVGVFRPSSRWLQSR